MAKKKYICAGCNKCTEPCTVELSGDADMTKDPAKMLHCGTWVEVPAEENTNKEQLPKLTADVFAMEECPDWAQFAAVDPDGEAYWYDGKPRIVGKEWNNESGYRARNIGQDYDASDWKNSCIERPVKVQIPKLTVDVFCRKECPEWAKYAAVDASGMAYWYAAKPKRLTVEWQSNERARRIDQDYDASDWKNSLVERRRKLTEEIFDHPECPADAVVAVVNDDGTAAWGTCVDIEPIGGGFRSKKPWDCHWTHIPGGACFDATDWQNSPVRRLRKLTEEIFDHPKCPADAVVAVVNASGTAAWGNCADIVCDGSCAFHTDHGNETWTYIPGGACFDASDWKNSAVYRAGVQPKSPEPEAPKLTYDVFSCSTLNEWKYVVRSSAEWDKTYTGCPAWARYAAVDKGGAVFVYENKPTPLFTAWADNGGRYARLYDADKHELQFDGTDWRNSLLELPTAMPRQKLTTDMFFCTEMCPSWARYAAVDANGLAFWYDAKPKLNKGARRWDNRGPCSRALCHPDIYEAIKFDASDWEHSLIERPESARLPKLTAEVFAMPECPGWARYAAVDPDGEAYWYAKKPPLDACGWCTAGADLVRQITRDDAHLHYDNDDWEHSLIERPVEEQLPKLTTDVFSMAECPEWAQYAAVDACGSVYWYEAKPSLCPAINCWFSNGLRTKHLCDPPGSHLSVRFDATDWEHSLIERPATDPLPKLTHDVFDMLGCPSWARYAAVDANGLAYYYSTKPKIATDHYKAPTSQCICVSPFDATDWEHSLIERPKSERLPKLTVEVFSLPQCPEWAKYAAVDEDGIVCYYKHKPYTSCGRWDTAAWRDMQALYDKNNRYIRYDASDWEHSLIERPVKEQLPKLAVDVFSMSECPAWAQYAAVDADGAAYWYDEKPMHGTCTWGGPGMHFARQIVRADTELRYDNSDWQNSLVERPAVAPKLTQDVFSAKECPEWARYASVDENGFAYWYEMQPQLRLGSCVWFSSGLRSQMMQLPNRFAAIIFDSTDWMHSLIERQPVAPRQKLTAEVFSMKECPYWAKYAAVDANGLAYWYDTVPCRSTSGLRWNNGGQRAMKICYAGEVATPLFDATDWEHSLIKRPATVPEWFKPGVLAYNNDTHTFFQITDSTEYCENYLEAKVRPFSDDELERLLGQFVCGPKNSRLLVTGFRPKGDISGKPEICVLCGWLTAEELLTRQQGIKQYHSTEGAWIDCGLNS